MGSVDLVSRLGRERRPRGPCDQTAEIGRFVRLGDAPFVLVSDSAQSRQDEVAEPRAGVRLCEQWVSSWIWAR